MTRHVVSLLAVVAALAVLTGCSHVARATPSASAPVSSSSTSSAKAVSTDPTDDPQLLGGSVPAEQEVTLLEPRANLDVAYAPGDTCHILYGGRITPQSARGARVRVSYQGPYRPDGPECPSGSVFDLDTSALADMAQRTSVVDQAYADQLRSVRALLLPQSQTPRLPQPNSARPVGELKWVRVLNPWVHGRPGIANRDLPFAFWSTCTIDRGGLITVIGQMQGHDLARYTTTPQSEVNCPSGTLFWPDDQQETMPNLTRSPTAAG